MRSRDRLVEVRDLSAYLFAALRRLAVRRVTGRAKAPVPLSDEPVDVADSPDDPRAEALGRALQCLPAEQRAVIALKMQGELTFNEIARVLEISPNTAASRYRYALEKLRERLQK